MEQKRYSPLFIFYPTPVSALQSVLTFFSASLLVPCTCGLFRLGFVFLSYNGE